MQSIKFRQISGVGLGMLVLGAALFGNFAQAADRIPRVLYVGDSWTGFMWGFRSMKAALEAPEYAADGLDRWIETGSSTAIMGAKAYEFLSPERQAAIAKSLADYPNIDVVVVTMGGNDFAGGFPVNVPGQGWKNKDWYDWYIENEYDSDPNNNWPEQVLFDQMKSDLRQILTHILAQRPDVRIALVGYDKTCRKCYQRSGLTIARQNQALLKMETTKRDLCVELAQLPEYAGRVEYIQSMGLIQNKYGYFTSNEWGDTPMANEKDYPPARPLSQVDVAPGVAPMPGTLANGYNPWPGGDPLWQDPRACYIDEDIHLQREGYDLSAKHALDVRIREWLNYPKVLSVIPQGRLGDTQAYTVTFSEPVAGVDVSDFELFDAAKSGAKAATITGVQPGSGGAEWVVTANLAGTTANTLLRVLDDDSITRTDNGTPLGGPGAGNGRFDFNGAYVFRDMLRPDDTDFITTLNYLDIASQPYFATYVPGMSFSPDRFDINGSFWFDGGSFEEPYTIPGNSMLEAYEFALITHMFTHPGLDLSAHGGPKASDVIAAWNHNIGKMQAALGGSGSISDILLPGLDTLLTGYMTLDGNPATPVLNNSSFLAVTLLTMLSGVDNFPVDVKPIAAADFQGFPSAFTPDADPDGDGWTNDKEYAYFLPDGPDAFAAAALDALLMPRLGDGYFQAGSDTRLPLVERPAWDGKIQWYRNGQPLTDGGNVSGSSTRCLVLSSLGAEDAGEYTCVYQTAMGSGGNRTYTDHTYPADQSISVRVGAAVPALVGLSQAEAETTLAGAGLVLGEATQECSNTVPTGVVIGQSVAAGETLEFGGAVSLTVSSGVCSVPVPNVSGMAQADAGDALVAANLVLGEVTRECSDTVPAGMVITQIPAPGQQIPFGSAVALVVASGPCTVPVPGVLGLTRTAAEIALNGGNLAVGAVTEQCSNTVSAGLVVSQAPPAGQQAPVGGAVALVVSTGVCSVSVPNVAGLSQTAAGDALGGVGLVVGTVTEQCSNTVAAGLVIGQIPEADQQAPHGSAVALAVSTGVCSVSVPNVAGLTQAAAVAALSGANLALGVVTQQCSGTVASGLVISQVPAADQQAPYGSTVALVVSTGMCSVSVPSVAGMTQATAGAALDAASLSLGTVTEQCSATVALGLVISQVPAADQEALSGSAVALVVSAGPCAAEGEVEGEGEGEVVTPTETELRDLLETAFATVDSNGDRQISYAEALAVLPKLPESVFNAVDADGDGQIGPEDIGLDEGGCAGCSGGKGAFTFGHLKGSFGGIFLGGLSLMVLMASGKHRQ